MKTPFFWSLCLFFNLVVLGTYAQYAVPIHPVDGEYIKEWLVLGPFFPADLETDFLADVGGEENIDPKEGDTVNLTPHPGPIGNRILIKSILRK